jgi:hypothetical protein
MPILGQFLDKASASASFPAAGSSVLSGLEVCRQVGCSTAVSDLADRVPLAANHALPLSADGALSHEAADRVHAEDLVHPFGWGHLVRQFRSL